MPPVPAADVKSEISLRMPAFDPSSAQGTLTGQVGEYLSDSGGMMIELQRLENEMQTEANARLGGIALDVAGAQSTLLAPRAVGVKIAAYLQNLLTTVLARVESRNGFVLGGVKDRTHGINQAVAVMLTGFTPPTDFRQLIQDRKPFKDPTVPSGHGEFSHRIQWYCVMQKSTLALPGGSTWADYYSWVGAQVHTRAEPGDQAGWINLGLWDALVDRNAYDAADENGPYNTATVDDFRSPEDLHEAITRNMRGGLPLLSAFLEARETKREGSKIREDDSYLRDWLTKKVYGSGVTYSGLSNGDQAFIRGLIDNKVLTPGPVRAQT